MAEQLKIGDNIRLKNSPSSFNNKTQGPMMVIQGSLGQKINIPIENYEITATITHQDDFVLCK